MLREELSAAERRLEDERFSSASSRQNFAAREQDLEVCASASINPLRELLSFFPCDEEHMILSRLKCRFLSKT